MMKPVSRSNPCPVCGRVTWCSLGEEDGVYCMRSMKVEHEGGFPPPGWTVLKRNPSDGGVFLKPTSIINQRLDHQTPMSRPRFLKYSEPIRLANWSSIQDELCNNIECHPKLQELMMYFGLDDPIHLISLGLGWHSKYEAWSFPMYDYRNTVVGIRLRQIPLGQFAIKGSRQGIFRSEDALENDFIMVAEGPSDTAALMSIGFDAIGRPSCRGAVGTTTKLLNGKDVVIVSDNDGPGKTGAGDLASELAGACSRVRIIVPTRKDAREAIAYGATKQDFENLISKAEDFDHESWQIQSESTG